MGSNRKYNFQDFERSVKNNGVKSDRRYQDALRHTLMLKHRTLYGDVTTKERADFLWDKILALFRFRSLKQGVLVTSLSFIVLFVATAILSPTVRGAVQQTVTGVSKCGVDIDCISEIAPLSKDINLVAEFSKENGSEIEYKKNQEGNYVVEVDLEIKNEGPDPADFVKMDLDIYGAINEESLEIEGVSSNSKCDVENEGENARKMSCTLELGKIADGEGKDISYILSTPSSGVINVKAKVASENKFLDETDSSNNVVNKLYTIESNQDQEGKLDVAIIGEESTQILSDEPDPIQYQVEINNGTNETYDDLSVSLQISGAVNGDDIQLMREISDNVDCSEIELSGSDDIVYECVFEMQKIGLGESLNIPFTITPTGEGQIEMEVQLQTEKFNNPDYVLASDSLTTEVVDNRQLDADVNFSLKMHNKTEKIIQIEENGRVELNYVFQYLNKGSDISKSTMVVINMSGMTQEKELEIVQADGTSQICFATDKGSNVNGYKCELDIGDIGPSESGNIEFKVSASEGYVSTFVTVLRSIKEVQVPMAIAGHSSLITNNAEESASSVLSLDIRSGENNSYEVVVENTGLADFAVGILEINVYGDLNDRLSFNNDDCDFTQDLVCKFKINVNELIPGQSAIYRLDGVFDDSNLMIIEALFFDDRVGNKVFLVGDLHRE